MWSDNSTSAEGKRETTKKSGDLLKSGSPNTIITVCNFTWDCCCRCFPESFRCGSLLQSCALSSRQLCWWWPLCKCSNIPTGPASTTGWAGLMWWSSMRLHLERSWCRRWRLPLPGCNMWSTVQPFLLMPNSLKRLKRQQVKTQCVMFQYISLGLKYIPIQNTQFHLIRHQNPKLCYLMDMRLHKLIMNSCILLINNNKD